MATKADWERVGRSITRRMDTLGMRQIELAEKAGVTRETIRKLQQGASTGYHAETLRSVEAALRWEPGTITRMLDEGFYGGGKVEPDGAPVDVAGSTLDLTGLTDSQREALRRMADEFHRANDT